jgi:multidrug resistance efflux pump
MTGIQIGEEEAALLSDPTAHYRINIESDSTIRADASRNRQEMTEFLSGSAQYFSTMAPIVQAAPMAAGELIEIYGAFARQFNLGKSAEDALDRLVKVAKQAAENPPPNPEAEAQKAEAEAKAKETAIKAQSEADKNDLERQKLQLEIQIKAAELRLKQQELQLKEGVETVKAAGALASFEQQESYNANGD